MKVGILTQPLINNYGGLLQAWALQRSLDSMGHEAIIINREFRRTKDLPLLHRIITTIKKEVNIRLGRESKKPRLKESQNNYIRKNIIAFVTQRYLGVSPDLYTESQLKSYISSTSFDGYIVGSDQVWRPRYSPELADYFLDFVKDNKNIKRVAYAASFGVDTWEFNDAQTAMASRLLPLFDLVTVRETSGINLIRDNLSGKATHVVDPTMLMNKEDYQNLIDCSTVPLKESDGELFCYVLDKSQELISTIQACVKAMNLKPFHCNALRKVNSQEDLDNIEECVFPPVEQWLKSFSDAKMIVTDSFHGTVFSIIFNKPFWVVANKDRGLTRFSSLLKMFELEDRIVSNPNNIDWNASIDWESVNRIRFTKADASKRLLEDVLTQ